MNHTHMHCIVPAGGLASSGDKWINAKKTKDNDFFIHVNVLCSLFKKKFMDYFEDAYRNHKLKRIGEIQELNQRQLFKCFKDKLYNKRWNVYCKPPFKSPEFVLEYLGRYTHRVAITNNRIVHFENGLVTFKWRDYKDGSKEKYMTVSAEEVIRRFLMHVLPKIKLTTEEFLLKLTGVDINLCPCCGKGKMITKEKLIPKCYTPPGKAEKTA